MDKRLTHSVRKTPAGSGNFRHIDNKDEQNNRGISSDRLNASSPCQDIPMQKPTSGAESQAEKEIIAPIYGRTSVNG